MKLYVVLSGGVEGSNDDSVEPGAGGVYSSREKATDAIALLMRQELEVVDLDLDEWDVDNLDDLSYDELTEVWEDVMDACQYVVVERDLDAPLRDLEDSADET